MSLSPDDLNDLITQVWTSYVDDHPLLPGPEHPAQWSASVTVTGAWCGIVTIGMSKRAARAVAVRMLGATTVTDEEISDAVGELVNMVGGNVKSLMPEPSMLSLPLVARGPVALPSNAGQACALALSWRDEPITLHLSHTADLERTS